jgi:hypothetical protein
MSHNRTNTMTSRLVTLTARVFGRDLRYGLMFSVVSRDKALSAIAAPSQQVTRVLPRRPPR